MITYNFEVEKIIKAIKKQKASRVLLQFPEGLKPEALKIVDEIESKTNAKCIVWIGSCYGSCDLPQGLEKLNIELLIQFGHTAWPFWQSKLEIKSKFS